MISINVQSNIDKVVREFVDTTKKQVSYAARKAVSKTAEDVRTALVDEMKRVLDRPTPYTLRSVYNRMRRGDPPTADVWLRDRFDRGKGGGAAAEYLLPQIEGGLRAQKRMEYALTATGYLPNGWVTVPGQGAKIDAYGNMANGQVRSILSALGAAELTSGYSSNRTATSAKRRRKQLAEYFVIVPGRGSHLFPGVYQKHRFAVGVAIKPLLMFVPSASYSKRLSLREVGHRTVMRVADMHFRAALAEAKARGI
jgi:hypothetical protein